MKNKWLFLSLLCNCFLLFSFVKYQSDEVENKIEYYEDKNIKLVKVHNKQSASEVNIQFYQNGFLKSVRQINGYREDEKGNNFIEFHDFHFDSTGRILMHTIMKDFKFISVGQLKGDKYLIRKK